jgi:hypothetical protein
MAANRYPDKIRLKSTGSIQSTSGHITSSTLPILKLRENFRKQNECLAEGKRSRGNKTGLNRESDLE